jgi:DNA invertase Pin-like site-specific DNA recombinase
MKRRVALYARVSTSDQTPENQLIALRAYAVARGWAVIEFTDVVYRSRFSGHARGISR